MNKIRISLLATIIIPTVIICFIVDRNIRLKSANRASMFISIDWLIRGEIYETGESPKSIEFLIKETYSSSYIRTFTEGILYRKLGNDGYKIEEKTKNFISLFRRDKLISDSLGKPRYESGGRVPKK